MGKKKIMDLIYPEPHLNDQTLFHEHKTRLEVWIRHLGEIQANAEVNDVSGMNSIAEFAFAEMCLKQMCLKRLNWVHTAVQDPHLRHKYLMVMPPFPQKGGLQSLLVHFFQFEAQGPNHITFREKSPLERELAILWDMYKLKKTLETIQVLEKSLAPGEGFPSIFSKQQILDNLQQLRQAFLLLFRMTIKTEYQKPLLANFAVQQFSPESVIKRIEAKTSMVYPHVVENFDYRNHFFFLYFNPGMKAKEGDKEHVFHYNFLDFEIVKQEFLTHWVGQRLAKNPHKSEIYEHFVLGESTLAERVAEQPNRELELLRNLPQKIFDDLIASFEDHADVQLPFDPMSERAGRFARELAQFGKVVDLAKRGVAMITHWVKEQKAKLAPPPADADAPAAPLELDFDLEWGSDEEAVQEEGPAAAKTGSEYSAKRLNKEEVSFPFLTEHTAEFSKKLNLLKLRMTSEVYDEFEKSLNQFFSKVNETLFCQRRTPKHEWSLPYLVTESQEGEQKYHLLILGAEVKAKPLSMQYGAKNQGDRYSFKAYFLLGADRLDPALGKPMEERLVRGRKFYLYDWSNPLVVKRGMDFYQLTQ